MNRYDREHLRRLARIERRISDIYAEAARRAANIAANSHVSLSDGDTFDIDKYPTVRRKIDELLTWLRNQIHSVVVNGADAAADLSDRKNAALLREAFGDAFDSLPQDVQDAYLSPAPDAASMFRARLADGFNVSQRVWALADSFKSQMQLGLEMGIKDGDSAARMTRDLRRYLKYPDKLFRRVRDKEGRLRLSKAAKAFHPGTGVYRSSFQNALRLAGTEVNIAYRTADHERWRDEDFVVGIEVKPSATNHTVPDICDDLAGQYPKDFKFTGWHPRCRCIATPILKTLDENQKDVDLILEGKAPDTPSKRAVTALPTGFRDWYRTNAPRLVAAKRTESTPYFIADNRALINAMLAESEKAAASAAHIEASIPTVAEIQRKAAAYFESRGIHVDPKDIDPEKGVVSLTWPQAMKLQPKQRMRTGDNVRVDREWVEGPAMDLDRMLRGDGNPDLAILGNLNESPNAGRLSPKQRSTVELLDRLIADNSLPFDLRVTRYVDDNAIRSMFGSDIDTGHDVPSALEGLRAHHSKAMRSDPAYMATSIDPERNLLWGTKYRLDITVPAGYPLFITDNGIESEALLPRGTRLVYKSADIEPNPASPSHTPQVVIHCRVMPLRRT